MCTGLHQKYQTLLNRLKPFGKVAVAFSGGVDSTFLLAAARTALPGNVIALTACSCVLPPSEWTDAQCIAQQWDIPHHAVPFDFLAVPGVAENPSDRCYWCKRELFKMFCQTAHEAGVHTVLEGSNADDWKDYRPGLRALKESPVKSPLCDAGFTKAEIRELSHELGLPAWAKPSMACLASRVPYGEPLTLEKLQKIGQAEQFLQDLGFGQIRVRYHGDTARIECTSEDFARFLEPHMRETISDGFRETGFAYTALDLRGYRTGSLNETVWRKGESQ